MNDILPFPFDAAREMRKANKARVDLIYQATLDQAERKFRAANNDDKSTQWPTRPDAIKVMVQPVQPLERLLAPSEINERTRKLESSQWARFFMNRSSTTPMGILWSDFYLEFNDRNAQIALENGLVCHRGGALTKTKDGLSRLYLFQLIERIVLSVQVAHQLYQSHQVSEGWALDVAVENLGEYQVSLQAEAFARFDRHHPGLVSNWVWNYHITAETFGDEALLNEFLLSVIQDICWGFGVSQIGREGLLNLSKQQGLILEPPTSDSDSA